MSIITSRFRARTVAVTVALAATAASTAYAQSPPPNQPQAASKQANIGVLTGLAVGAAAGGPIGAVVGAAAGAFIGDRYHRQIVAREALKEDLARKEAEQQQLSLRLTTLDDSLHASQAESERVSAVLARAKELSMQLSFRTDDSELGTQDVARVQELAGLAAALPAAKIQIDGYADPRGSQAYNQQLSEERAQEVAEVLKSAGIDPQRLIVQGHGASEAHCAQGDLDGYALERRVTVRLSMDTAVARVP
jgi:outer membrane protein OmpA-like peptidoglycan-associated protein